MDELLDGYSTIMEFPVAWGDMDAFSHIEGSGVEVIAADGGQRSGVTTS